MYKQSNEAKLAYQSAERTLDIVVNVNGVDYKATDIEQFDYDSGGYTGDTFSIGSTYENNITVKFIHLVEGLKRGMIVKPRIGIKLPNGTFEYTPLGVFIIADEIQMDRNNNSTTIKAYDKFVLMEGQYVSKLTYPANAVDIITEIAQMCKVDVNTDDLAHLPTIKVSKAITKQSYRTAIGWIAQLYVGFASFDRDGKLTIRRVAEPNYTIEPSEYEQQGLVKNEAPYIIGGISCNVNVVETTNNGETNETTHKLHSGSVNGSQIELTNDIMTQELLDSIWNSLKTITFYPFSLNWFGNPAIEAGDWLSLKDMKGNLFVVPNNGYTISFNGGLSSTSKADQNATDSSTVKYTGELTRAIENYSRRQAPDGTNIYTDVKEPTDAKFNDVWFKPNGNSTELWIFERQSDGTGKWVKQPVNGEVEQKINDALKDFDELDKSFKDNANTQSATNELMKSRIDSISNQIPNLSDEISRVNGNVTSLKTQTDKDRQQLQSTSQNLDQARQDLLSNSNRIDKLSVGLDSVNINVNNVNSKIDNIKVGGTNLAKNTSNTLTNRMQVSEWAYIASSDNVANFNLENYKGQTLTMRAWIDKPTVDARLQVWTNATNNNYTAGNTIKTGQSGYSSLTFKVPTSFTSWNIPIGNGKAAELAYKELKIEKGTIATDWSPAPEDEIERVSQLKVDLNGINATVATNKGDIAQIKLTENGMQQSIKDAQGNISTLQNDSKQFKQQFQDVNGNIATIKNDANSLSSQLSTKVGTSEYNSFKNQTAQELRTKLNASDLSGYAKSADVKVSVDGLNARFDNLNVGGTNLLFKTKDMDINNKNWYQKGSNTYYEKRQDKKAIHAWGDWSTYASNQTIHLEANTDYVVSAYIMSYQEGNKGSNGSGIQFGVYAKNTADNQAFTIGVLQNTKGNLSNTEWKRFSTVYHNTTAKDITDFRIEASGDWSTVSGNIWIAEIKLETGNIATDYTPAPEDVENKIEVLSGKITANSNEFSTVYSKITNAKNDAINTIKGDNQWQSMGKIVTNAAFLQNANGFAQEVSKTTTPMVSGGGKNLARGTSDSWTGVYTKEFNGSTNFTKKVADVYLDDLNVGDKVTVQIIYQYNGVTATNAKCWLQGSGNVTGWNSGNFYGTPTTINMTTDSNLKNGSFKYTFDITSDMKKNRYWSVAWRFDNVNKGAWFQWLKFKVEKGSVATPWIPAPEDLATKLQLNDISSRTEFLQDNSKFLSRVQEAGAATGGVNNLLTNGDTFSGYSENNTNNFDFQKIEGSGLPAVPNQPSITMMGHVWDNYGSAYNKNDGIYLENGETYWFGVYLMTDSNAGAFRNLSVYATTDKNSNSGSANKYFAGEVIDFNRTFKGKTKTWVWNTYQFTGDGTTRYNWRIEPYNHIGGSIWTAGYMLVKSPFPPTDWTPSPEDLATKLQLNQVIDTADSHTRTISDYLTGSNSRFVQMANYLNMNVKNSSVSINGDGVMLSGNRIKITGKTLIDNAVILDALIKDINANTVKTKELDASKINVTNLNANNITSGTISGTNLNINLDSGNVSFQSGRIHDSNNYVDINIDQRYISTSNLFTRVILKNGKMQLMDQKLFDITDDYYFEISNEGKGGTQWLTGATLLGKNSVFLGTKIGAANGSVTEASPMGQTKSSGISVDDYQPTLITGSNRGVMIKGGETFRLANGDTTPYISVGTGQGGISKNRIIIDADYVHFPSVNLKTTSSSPNVYVASDGALVRSTSASKYKSDISRTHDMDYGNKLLELPIATWIDKAEFERYAKKESEQPPIRHFGMIAEDLADVGLEMLVTRNESGELEGIQYDRIAPALIPVIADLKRRLENLERKQQTNE